MNINCLICTDLFSPAAETFVTSCGHMFHYACLMQWIERSKTCPQCRFKVTEKTIHRVFFNLQSNEGVSEDIGTLQNRLDNLNFQIKLKEKDTKIYLDKYKTVKFQNAGLREEVKGLEDKARATDSAMHALKQQIQFYKKKSQDGERMVDEVKKLKDQLNNLNNLQLVLNGSLDQVNNMLQYNNDPEALCLLVNTLKKELVETTRKKRQLSTRVVQIQNECNIYKKERDHLKKENTRLEAGAHLNCEMQRKALKSKIVELQSKLSANSSSCTTPDTSIRRIIAESPAPFKPSLDTATYNVDVDSPTVEDRVRAINESDSPYLPIKPTSVTGLLNFKYTTTVTSPVKPVQNNYSKLMLYRDQNKLNDSKMRDPDVTYNGMGGHSKVDTFPIPARQSAGSKRPKSSVYTSANKFRKLAENKKLDHCRNNS